MRNLGGMCRVFSFSTVRLMFHRKPIVACPESYKMRGLSDRGISQPRLRLSSTFQPACEEHTLRKIAKICCTSQPRLYCIVHLMSSLVLHIQGSTTSTMETSTLAPGSITAWRGRERWCTATATESTKVLEARVRPWHWGQNDICPVTLRVDVFLRLGKVGSDVHVRQKHYTPVQTVKTARFAQGECVHREQERRIPV